MKEEPLISVIMGVYNPKLSILKESIKSIANQTIKDFEIIICDDGSDSDEHLIWLHEYAEDKNINIHILRNIYNMGLSVALNKCIYKARGKFIARMDDDDICYPNRFYEQIRYLECNESCMFVGSNVAYINENNEIWGYGVRPENPQICDFYMNVPYVHPTIMFRREVFACGDLYCTSKIATRVEDLELWMRLYGHNIFGGNIQKNLLKYREDKNSFTKRKFRYRLHSVVIRLLGFYEMGILPKRLIYCFRPILSSFVPKKIMMIYHKNKFYINEEE